MEREGKVDGAVALSDSIATLRRVDRPSSDPMAWFPVII